MSDTQPAFGLLAIAYYAPRLRLERSAVFEQHRWMAPGLKSLAKGQRTMANWDEDTVTMAVEAGRALMAAPPSGTAVELTLASTTLPFADRLNAGIVAAALGLTDDAVVRDVASSSRAALTELAAALRHPAPDTTRIIVASERRTARPGSAQEMIFGDGAAAACVGTGPAIATLVAARSVHADFVDHFRQTGEAYEYGWEERWVRDEGYMKLAADTVLRCLVDAGVSAADVAHFALPAPVPRINEAVAKRAGIAATALVPTAAETIGDLGCAQPLAMLDTALRAALPGALILVAAFGSGCDVLLLKRTSVPCPGRESDSSKAETSYMKYLSFTGQIALAWGMRAEMDNKPALTAAWRDHARTERFEGGECTGCGTVQFPRSRLCVNPACKAQDTQSPTSFVDRPARVLSHTSDFLGYTPAPPFQFGHIDFEGGGRVLMEFADTDRDELAVGAAVRMVYRIKDLDAARGFRRYFWKATPVRGDADRTAPASDAMHGVRVDPDKANVATTGENV